MGKIYRIRNWNDLYENNRTRRIKDLNWVPVSNRHDGEGFQRIMRERDGIAIYGCWHLILQVASRCHPRGTLVRDDGTPLDAESISIKTGWNKVQDFKRALEFCARPEIGWIEIVTADDAPQRQGDVTTTSPRRQLGGPEQNRTEQNRRELDPPIPPPEGGPVSPPKTTENGGNGKPSKRTVTRTPALTEEIQDEIMLAWNLMAREHGLPTVSVINGSRLAKLKRCWRDEYWRRKWRDAIGEIPKNPFLTGKNDRGWRATFDWFIRDPSNLTKTLDGTYRR